MSSSQTITIPRFEVTDFLVEDYGLPFAGTIDFDPVRKDFMNKFLGIFNNHAIRNKIPQGTMKGMFYMSDVSKDEASNH